MSSSARCIAAMTTALGREPTAAELENIVDRLERKMAQKRRARDGKTDAQLYREAAYELAPEIAVAALQAKRSRLINIKTRDAALARHEGFVAAGIEDPSLTILSMDTGINANAEKSRDSVEKRHKTMFFQYTVGGVISDLYQQPEGRMLWKMFNDRNMELPIMQELAELSKRAVGEPSNVGVSGSREALAIANTVRKWQTIARNTENEAGSWRGEVWGYTTGHHWDSRGVWKIGKDEFRRDMLRSLDERTFERQQSRIDHLQATAMSAAELFDHAYAEFRQARKLLETSSSKIRNAYDVLDVTPAKLDALDKAATRIIDNFKGGMPDLATMKAAVDEVGRLRSQIVGRGKRAAGRLKSLDPEARGLVEQVDRIWDIMRKAEQRIAVASETAAKLDPAIDDRMKFIDAAFDDIVTDRHLVAEGARADFDGNLPFVGPGNLAERVSRNRVLHFKDAAAELEMVRKYGAGTLSQRVISEMDHTARNTALMQMWGTNPERNRQEFIGELLDRYHGDPKKTGPLQSNFLDSVYAQVNGSANVLAKGNHSWIAAWGQGIRAYNVVSLLGNMLLAQFGDVATRGREMRYQGHNFLSAYGRTVESLFEGMGSEQRKKVGMSMGVGWEGMLGAAYSRFADTDPLPGKMAKIQHMAMKVFGATYWTDWMKRGQAFQTAHDFVDDMGKAFSALDAPTTRLLEMYGIDARMWDVIRKAQTEDLGNGARALMPDGIYRMELETFMDFAGTADPARLMATQDDVALRWRMMLMDRADVAVPGPDARTRAVILGDSKRGTFEGETRRFMGQFKGFPIGVIFGAMGREIYGRRGESTMSKVAAVSEAVLMGTAMGYLSLVASDMQKGWWPPRDPLDPRTWIASAQRGGGFGIYGDVIFGEYHDFGRTLSSTLLGPTIGGIGDPVAKMIAKTLRFAGSGGDEKYNPGYDAFRFVKSHAPVLNMHLVGTVLDIAIMRDLAEAVNPGAQQRFERRRERDWGQRMYWND